MLDQAYKILLATLHQTNYHVKKLLGVLDISYYSYPDYSLYGTRQGSGCAGTVWLFQSTPMIETIKKYQGFDITSSDSSQSWTKHTIGLVDDKRQYANNWKGNSKQTIYDNLQNTASS